MTLTELKQLAQAAARDETHSKSDDKVWVDINTRYVFQTICSPDRILAMIACIESADAIWDYGNQPSEAYKAARAKLEQK